MARSLLTDVAWVFGIVAVLGLVFFGRQLVESGPLGSAVLIIGLLALFFIPSITTRAAPSLP